MVSTLDNTASEIVQYQRDSTVQRKDLAQKTKDFRKLDDPGKLNEIKTLLKAYQTFIDLLTNHSKSTNSAFLQVYSSLSEAPDPYPLLEASVDSLLLSEDTLPKVTRENQYLQKSVSKLTTQLEETELRLEAERTARKGIEEGLETKVREVENSWAAVLEEKKDNWEAKEKSLEEKVENQDRLLNEIKASYEVNQRLGQTENSHDNGRGHVTSAELEMVNSDLERTSMRLAEIEARNEQLRIELAQSASQVPSQPAVAIEDDPGYMRIQSENSSLLRKLDAARVERDARKRDLDGKLRSLEREIGMLKTERDNLKSKVQKWSDYEDVKQELEVLKSIEFSTGDDDDLPETSDTFSSSNPDNSQSKGKGDTLEQLLLARNKKLSDELTILRVSHQDLQSRLQTMQQDLSKTNAELELAQNLNATLENDLANVQESNPYPSGASVAGTYASRYPQSSANTYGPKKGRVSPTSSIISGFDPRTPLGSTSLEALRSGEPVGGGSGILPMITAQRDRFKKRNTQLENELSESHRTVSSLRQEIASLQKDNLNLYEKTSDYDTTLDLHDAATGIASRRVLLYIPTLSSTASRPPYSSSLLSSSLILPNTRSSYYRFSMFSKLWIVSALCATALAAPPTTTFAAPGDMKVLSEYFSMLGQKVEAGKRMATAPVCNLNNAALPVDSPTPLPAVSQGLTLKHVAVGRGIQNYTCTSNPTDVPVSIGAIATLYNATCLAATYPDLLAMLPNVALQFNIESNTTKSLPVSNLIVSGHHYFSNTTTPAFNLDTANMQLGIAPCSKNNTEAAPAGASVGQNGQGNGAVAWLKLIAREGATGGLEEVYRLNTAGGNPPATCAGMPSTFEVQYAAEYWFFQK
ncbi:hypothetical protein B7494_g5992 [Chlorociboria aeruginascens]|nr:hypothetical protein B7494_g5992 [Chlorociboria aeruginascens]